MKKLLLLAPLVSTLIGCTARDQTDKNKTENIAPQTQAPKPTNIKAPAKSTKAPKISRVDEVPNAEVGPNGLTVPRGFAVSVWADKLDGPRRLLVVPRGKEFDVLVAESAGNRVSVLHAQNGTVKSRATLLSEQRQPFGLAIKDGQLFVGNTDGIVRASYRMGADTAGAPTKILELPDGGHWTRNILPSRDGKKLFVAVGSSCNVCEDPAPLAAISTVNWDGTGLKTFASGLRNPVGMALRPGSDELWTVVNERDNLGDDLPPDYLTRVDEGAFYGWPYALTDINGKTSPDPSFGDKNPALVKKTTAPTVPVQAHSAALGVAWYPDLPRNQVSTTGTKYFPSEFRGDAFLAFHGSWNRSAKTGYKIVRVDFENGVPVGVSDFVRGFQNGDDVWGRPVDVAVAPDGSLLFSDDDGGKIWRVSRK